MGNVSLSLPKHKVIFLATSGAKPFHLCSHGITTVRNRTSAVSGVVQVLSHPGELLILPNMFSWVNIIKQTLFGVFSWKAGAAALDDILKLQNFRRSWFLVMSSRGF